MRLRDTSDDATYDMTAWVKRFRAGAPDEKRVVAESWLEAFLDDLRKCRGMNDGMAMKDRLIPHMLDVRSMLWEIQPGHPVFDQPPYSADNPAGTWLRNYINMSVPLMSSTNASKIHAALRDMWLHPDAAERRRALNTLARDPRKLKVLGLLWDSLIRDAAWETVDEAEQSESAVHDATRLTLWTYRGINTVNLHIRHELCNAVNTLLARCESEGAFVIYGMQAAKAKSLLTPYPAACIRLLQWLEDTSARDWLVLGQHAIIIDALATWFPGSQSSVRLSGEMGLSHREILRQLEIALFVKTAEMVLPEDIAIGTGP